MAKALSLSGALRCSILGLIITLMPCSTSKGAVEAFLSLRGIGADAATINEPVKVLGFSNETENNINIGSISGGGGAGKARGKQARISFTPNVTVTEIFSGLVTGAQFQLRLSIRRSKGGAVLGELSFDDVLFNDLEINAASGDDLAEIEVGFQYGAMFWTEYHHLKKKGDGVPTSAGWSFITNKPEESDFFGIDDGGGGGGVNPPQSNDNDKDGIPNDWEDAHGMNKDLETDAPEDMDGDSLSNYAEYVAGTDPQSATSFFRTTLSMNSGDMELEWSSMSGRIYRVYEATDPQGEFTFVTEITAGAGETTIYNPSSDSGPFFLVEVLLAP